MINSCLNSSNLDWTDLKKHSSSHSFINILKQSHDVFPNSGQSKLLDFSIDLVMSFYKKLNEYKTYNEYFELKKHNI